MSEQTTHPVYIDSGMKAEVKKTAADVEESMKTVTERYVENGHELSLHELESPDGLYAHLVNQLVAEGVLELVDEDEADVDGDIARITVDR